jgi:hypothetical protein
LTTKKKTAKKSPAKVAKKQPPKAPATVLILRTTDKDGKSYGHFQWPEIGPVECSDWSPQKKCGNGLHGWLWGAGDWSLKSQGVDIKWKVVEVLASDVVDIDGSKVKFPKGNVIATFTAWADAMAVIRDRALKAVKVKAVATESREIASATGNYGHASATGDYGHASATGYPGHASATGDYGHASATGDSGHASATGYSGHASATGYSGWAVAGYKGKAKAAANGVLTVLWWDEKSRRPRVTVGYVGEEGIEADQWYGVESGKLVKVSE